MGHNEAVLTIGIVAGERSGEKLATQIVTAIAKKSEMRVRLIGVGGPDLAQLGLKTLFDPDEIALMGISAVVKSLPRLLRRIGQTADLFIAEKPDCILLVDSPDFSHRVARKVKAALPEVPVIKYVAPTVWAWRPERAPKMTTSIDAVLALFPFEPEIMEHLGGPKTTYVGHPLAIDEGLRRVAQARAHRERVDNGQLEFLFLAGSRKSEITMLINDMRGVLDDMIDAGVTPKISMPTVERHADLLRKMTADWPIIPLVTTTRSEQLDAFERADAALCASGTVTLELALSGVPAVSIYRLDALAKLISSRVTIWSAALPNVIADRPVVAEFIDHLIRPGMLRRHLMELADRQSHRHALTLEGYRIVAERMAVDHDPADLAAHVALELIHSHR